MSGRVHLEVQAAPKSSFMPVRTGLLAGSRGKQLVSQPPLIQAKLTINKPNDRYEQEADRVADSVMRMLEPEIQRQVEEEQEEEILQRKTLVSGTPSVDSIATELSGMPTGGRAPALLALQQTHDNRYVQRVVAGIQAKLKVGQPGDKYEQEADLVADEVMQISELKVQQQPEEEEEEEEELIQTKPLAEQITPLVRRQVEEEKEELIQPKLEAYAHDFIQRQVEEEEEKKQEELIQTKPISEQITPLVQRQVEEEEEEFLQAKSRDAATRVQNHSHSLTSGGQSFSRSDRVFFETRFGRDFSRVRVHSDGRANELAHAVSARAFTVGHNIVFGSGEYTPRSASGRRLLAHELTHVIQQQGKHSPPTIQRQAVRGDLASRSELMGDGFNWRLWEANLSSGGVRPFIHNGLLVSGRGYAFGIKFSSNCSESLVQTVLTRTGYLGAGGGHVGARGRDFVELFGIENGRTVGIDQHTHPTPSPQYLAGIGIHGAASHCLEIQLAICCGNFAGQTVPSGRRGMVRRYRPQDVHCRGPRFTYHINYCGNGQDFSLRVSNFPVDITSFTDLQGGVTPITADIFTAELLRRLGRYGIIGSREVDRYMIINPAAKRFVQRNGVNGAEALFFAQGDVSVGRRFLQNLADIRALYDRCLTSLIGRPERSRQQWSEFVRHNLSQQGFGLCSQFSTP